MVGPASTSQTAGRPGARPRPPATSGSISASSPASSTPVAPPADRPGPGEQPLADQVETSDLGLDEADPRGQHPLERDAYRIGGASAGGDPGQLGDRLVVVVPVDQGQLYQ